MSQIYSKLLKILSENVVSGDLKIINFKSKLRIFLEYSTEQLNELLSYSKDQVSESIKAAMDGFSKEPSVNEKTLPVPKCGRLWISIVYAIIVLNADIVTDVDAKGYLIRRYGEKSLVFDAETLHACVEHAKVVNKINSSIGRKRKLPTIDEETQAKRAKLMSNHSVSYESQEEAGNDSSQAPGATNLNQNPPKSQNVEGSDTSPDTSRSVPSRKRNPPVRYEPNESPLDDYDDESGEEDDCEDEEESESTGRSGQEESSESSARESNSKEEESSEDKIKEELRAIGQFARVFLSLSSKDAIIRGAELCFKYLHSYSIRLVLPPKNEERVKSFQVKNELHAATFAVPVTISEESVESDSRHFSSEESDTNEKKRKRNNEKPQKSRKKKCSTTPGDKSLDGDNKSPVSQSPSPRDDGPNTTPSIHETSCKLFLKVAQPRYCLDTELFQLVTKKIESGASMEEIRLEFQAIDLIPESFVQCWYNPALIQCPTDKVLEGCVRSSSTLKKPCRRLVIAMKLQYFVLSTTVDAIRMQFDSESMANAVPNAQVTDLQATSNEKLLAYVTSNGYFKQLRDCGFVPNSLFEGKKQKESLRR